MSESGTPRLAIPNLGNYSIALATAVESLGIEAWWSTATTPTAMKLGREAAPEAACLPFKAHIGHFIEAAQSGVEYALMVNSVGTCRLRYYRKLCEQIIEDLGLPIRVFGLGYEGFKPPLVRYFDPPLWPFLRKVRHALVKIGIIDTIELETWRLRPLELEPGRTTRLMMECFADLEESRTAKHTLALREDIIERFRQIPIDQGRETLRAGLIGEISMLRDKTLNHNVEEILGNMGVSVRNFFLLGAELGNIFRFASIGNKDTRRHLAKIAAPYLKVPVGGHALDSVAHTIRCSRDGYDGMIHLCPTGCMPESSVRPILTRVSEDYDIPVLMISFDEHTTAVGVTTRLEAFVDTLRERRKRRALRPSDASFQTNSRSKGCA